MLVFATSALVSLISTIAFVELFGVDSLYPFLAMLAITGFITLRWGMLKGVIAASVFILGIALVVAGWALYHPGIDQFFTMELQTLGMTVFTSWWLMIAIAKHIYDQLTDAKRQLRMLLRQDPTTGILTKSEFLNEARIIINTMNRRGEKGMLIVIRVVSPDDKEPKAVLRLLGAVITKSIRNGYDIAGKLGKSTIGILLQNADEHVVDIVLDRIKSNLEKNPHVDVEKLWHSLDIWAVEMPNNYEEAKKLIDNLEVDYARDN